MHHLRLICLAPEDNGAGVELDSLEFADKVSFDVLRIHFQMLQHLMFLHIVLCSHRLLTSQSVPKEVRCLMQHLWLICLASKAGVDLDSLKFANKGIFAVNLSILRMTF